MKASKFTEAQIAFILKQAEDGVTIAGVASGVCELAFLCVGSRFRRLSRQARHGRPENAGVRRHRLRQPGEDLYQSQAPAPVVLSPERVASRLVSRRHRNRFRARHR